MPPQPTTDSGYYRPFTKVEASEPLPGYKLIEPLGRGGFGEVWKCEAPGGLHKAIKFVPGAKAEDGQGERRLNQELEAFQQIKSIRHPFLLTLERVEMLDGELVMVMELADRQLQDRFKECRNCGLPGIPRDELMAYFADAAEALDMISAKYGLQHLDVKPANLFLVAGHVKVGDYGLVASLEPDDSGQKNRGLTPKYVAPEALRGEPSHRSDQYSLALVYQELLTGTFPYPGKSAQQIMMQHATATPDVSPLPVCDRPIVLKALSKDPAARYGSCLGFVQALLSAASAASLPTAAIEVRRARVERSRAQVELPIADDLDTDADSTGDRQSAEATHNSTLPGLSAGTTSSRTPGPMPRLVAASTTTPPPRTTTPAPRPPAPRVPSPGPLITTPGPVGYGRPLSLDSMDPSGNPVRSSGAIILNPVKSVVPLVRLTGQGREERPTTPDALIREVIKHAAAGGHVPQVPGDIGRRTDGTWVCKFPTTVAASVVPMKLVVVAERWGVSLEQPQPNRLLMRWASGGGGFWGKLSKKKSAGFEVRVEIPSTGQTITEMEVTGGVFGDPDRGLVAQATDALPKIMDEVRRELRNVEDRRKHPRVATDFSVSVYSIHSDGAIGEAITGRCLDVSAGGLCIHLPAPPGTKYFYVVFDEVEAVARQAILVRTVRLQTGDGECICAGIFRTDF